MTREELNQLCDALTKRMANDGCLIEMGWVALRRLAVPPNAPDLQVNEMRMAFMAGAQHLFTSILSVLDPGEEPTDADLRRLDLIHKELETFRKEMELRVSKAKGSA